MAAAGDTHLRGFAVEGQVRGVGWGPAVQDGSNEVKSAGLRSHLSRNWAGCHSSAGRGQQHIEVKNGSENRSFVAGRHSTVRGREDSWWWHDKFDDRAQHKNSRGHGQQSDLGQERCFVAACHQTGRNVMAKLTERNITIAAVQAAMLKTTSPDRIDVVRAHRVECRQRQKRGSLNMILELFTVDSEDKGQERKCTLWMAAGDAKADISNHL